MRKTLLIALAGLGLAMLASSGMAQAEGEVSFGIRPTRAFESRPGTFSYFSYELTPGAVLSDEALVMNSGEAPVTLKLYAADGITAGNGGVAFARVGQESSGASGGVSRWLSLSVREIALDPGEEMIVPFTINVPPDASSGHHVAGLVVEAPPSGEGEGQFVVEVVQQAGVAVVIDVAGPNVARLEITGTCLKQQGDDGATFEIDVHNTGNVFLKGVGSVFIMDRSGDELASNPLKMETVLPGDATTFQVTHPLHLADGDYLVSVDLEYEESTTVLEEVEISVKGGQPAVGCELTEERGGPLPPREIIEISPPANDAETGSPSTDDGGLDIGRNGAIGAFLLAAGAAIGALTIRRIARRVRAD